MTECAESKSWGQRLFTVLWIWISFCTVLPWLVFFRLTFEGDSYSWGSSYFGHMFHSSGLARPDFLVVYALLAAGLGLLYLLRSGRLRIARPLLLVYLGFFAANALYQLLAGEQMIFRGDTLDLTLDLTLPFFIFQFGMFALGLAWFIGTRNVESATVAPALPPRKRLIVKACMAFVPVQLALLMLGEPHALSDEIGVIGTMLQWLLLSYALYPGAAPREAASRMPAADAVIQN